MSSFELIESVARVEQGTARFPCVFLGWVSFPRDEVAEASASASSGHDPLDFEHLVAIGVRFRFRWRPVKALRARGEFRIIGNINFQFTDVKNRVESLELGRKLEPESICINNFCDRKGTNEASIPTAVAL